MPCRTCAERRKMIAHALKQDGARGAVKVLPRVFRSIVTRKPKAAARNLRKIAN